MKTAIQTAIILDRYGIEEGYKLIAESGFEAVDINLDTCLPGKQIREGDVHGFFDQPDAALLAFCDPHKQAAARYGIAFTQAHAPFPNRVQDAAVNDYLVHALKKTIMMCGYLNCKNVVVHPGFLPFGEPSDEWDFNIRMYSALIPDLREHGVVCCLENMFHGYRGKIMCGPCSNAVEANRYIDALNDIAGERLFGFCLDVGHALLVGRDIHEFIVELGDNLACLHIHDNDGNHDEHLYPYMGIVDWDRFIQGLRDIHYRGDLDFETFHGLDVYPPELSPQVLRLAGATCARFRERILA